MQTVVELTAFKKKAEKLFSADELIDVINFIAANPFSGNEIPGTGGVRKLRFAAKGKGKRGGSRVIYFVFDEDNPIYLLACYGKNEKGDLTPDEKKAVTAFATASKAIARKRKKT
jgi:hypothetical protein